MSQPQHLIATEAGATPTHPPLLSDAHKKLVKRAGLPSIPLHHLRQGRTPPKLPWKVTMPPCTATSCGPSGSPCSAYQMGTPSISSMGHAVPTLEAVQTYRLCAPTSLSM